MRTIEASTRLTLKNILLLTDFSEPSEVALSYALSIAREYEAKVCAVHVLTPVPLAYASLESAGATIEGLEEGAQNEMQRLDSQLAGVDHETMIVRGESVWSGIQQILASCDADLLVVGTHGRTGAMKLLLGSVAEEIFRRSRVPVLTIGPSVQKGAHGDGQFHRVMLATDFTPEATGAAPVRFAVAAGKGLGHGITQDAATD